MSCAFGHSATPAGGGGIRTREPSRVTGGTPACAAGRIGCGASSLAARPGFEPGFPGSEPGVVPVALPRIGLDGETRTPNPRLPGPVRSHCATSSCFRSIGTDGRIRTDTGGGLSAVPLPVGLRQHWWTERESNPRPPPCKGVTLPVALSALVLGGWWRGRGSNPRAGRMRPR